MIRHEPRNDDAHDRKDVDDAMTASNIHPPTAADQQNPLRSAFRAAFIVAVTGGTLAGTGLVLWLLKALATSRYGVYFGV
ncbi:MULTISPECIES: hypothetical protein [unclassified Mycobacterium]|uniref:hypothetical protein n=1 Tax=unclassified Mycobacterium TaxID=2642494 RepID=UPI0006DC24BA|nr:MULTISPECIES: hypothetical protein [unclassified Mycobacterium]OBH84824.1 hypothetical protein A5680_09000 [Mycobacterium sp. E2989]